jgi:hypothetical protein
MSEARKFQHIVDGIREDLTLVEELCRILDHSLSNMLRMGGFLYEETTFQIKEWISDVFLDKIYEIDSKIHRFLIDVCLEEMYDKVSLQEMEKYIKNIVEEKKGFGYGDTFSNLAKLRKAISNYREAFNTIMNYVRKFLYETNWTNIKKINIEDYLFLTKKQKYIKAREELQGVKQSIKDGKYEDILNHLRAAIELAIKERFGFKNIKKMWHFLNDAEVLNLPSYDMLYFYYDEGSHRLHSGRLNTPFECQQALQFVDSFIDRLELINISQEEIDNFKKKCQWVE